jgi:molecular chaperone IbpA|tara:strand:+ start:209 stop:679 length:471 start_codon:yes stop_codon:yes gene_type:complete
MTRIDTINLPHFHKATIGFDRLFNELNRGFENSPNGNGYPPYNIAQINEDEYMISVAVAGFGMDNLDVTKDGNQLQIVGTAPKGDDEVNYLHKGIGGRNFRREFTLADHVNVAGASLDLGMLNVHLLREVPEALKPKKIEIVNHSGLQTVIEEDSE